MSDSINHRGIIDRIEGDTLFVRIMQQSACAGCHAKGMCSASESKEKIIEVRDNSHQYTINEEVILTGKTSLGLKAVLLAFVIPVLIVVGTIIIGNISGWEEASAALASLVVLIPYYGVLYLLREKLKRTFVFTLKKLN
ncbi:MAG: SoxR reducing system RseC family protein [Tannerellaceae bacterium]|nr:SoxR reducing system RseC family protein [Tannerellaceae bacterium]